MLCQGSQDKHNKSDKLVQITCIHVFLFKVETQAGQNPSLLFLCVFIDLYASILAQSMYGFIFWTDLLCLCKF